MRVFRQLWLQVLIATLAGIALGLVDPQLGAQMKPLGDAFIALIRMMIAPVIFCTVVHGIGGMRDLKRASRVALKAIAYFEAVTTLALIFALVAVNLWKPGAGMNIDPRHLNANPVHGLAAQAHAQSITQYILEIIPTTFIGAFTAPNVLPVLLVSILFGVGLSATGERGRPVFDFIGAVSQIIFRIVGFIMWVAPIGAFGAIAFTVGAFGTSALISLGSLLAEFYAVSALFVVIVFGAILRTLGLSLIKLMKFIGDELLVVAATTSSETVLPRLIQKLEALGCEESVVGLVIPAGYSFNLDGTCLYLVTACVFLAQATNTPLSLPQQLGLILVLLLTSKGAAGVAGAALIALAATLSSTATIPVASIALILGIHRLMAEALTFVNVIGNCVATIVVAKWDGALDNATLTRQIGIASSRILTSQSHGS
jgi:aerobic C4-dicarboxylate transport protein